VVYDCFHFSGGIPTSIAATARNRLALQNRLGQATHSPFTANAGTTASLAGLLLGGTVAAAGAAAGWPKSRTMT
jgi:hypothetical protein